jgi:hypothetical protein
MKLDRVLSNIARGRRFAQTRTPRRSTRPKGEGAGYFGFFRSLLRRR